MSSIAPPKFKWEDLPCTPYTKNRAFTIYVPKCEVDQNNELPDLGLTWNECPAFIRKAEAVKEALKSYKLRTHAQAGDGRLFTFGKPLSVLEQNTIFHTRQERQPDYWPTVLQKLWFERHVAENGTVQLLPRTKIRTGNTYPTTFIINEYFSDEPWKPTRFSKLFPTTASISYDFESVQGSIPECLHPGCVFPSFQTLGVPLYGAGTTTVEIGSDLNSQEFPATAMQDWERYTKSLQTSEVLGMWHYIETIAVPPINDTEDKR